MLDLVYGPTGAHPNTIQVASVNAMLNRVNELGREIEIHSVVLADGRRD